MVNEENNHKEIEKEKYGFIYYGLRISFWVMIGLWLISYSITEYNINSNARILLGLVWVASTVFTFITSIIHLTKYKRKGMSITSLVISSYVLICFLIGVIIDLLRAGIIK